MNSYLLKDLSGITPASIEKFLLVTGWVREDSFKNNNIWLYKDQNDPGYIIAVPANVNLVDFYPRIYDVVKILSNYYEKSESDIIDSLKSAFTDRIRFRIIMKASENGKIPLDYAARCLDGLKDLVLYAACAEENARPVCQRAFYNAKNNMEKFQFAQTEVGSYVFNIDVSVASEENEQIFFTNAIPSLPEPVEHKIIKRIEKAFEQVVSIVEKQTYISEIIDNAYVDGITANMCDAIMQIKPEDGKDITLESSVFYAEAITHSVAEPKINVINNIHFAIIDEISKRYKDFSLVEDVTLNGTIKMLQKTDSGFETENTVRLLAKIDNTLRSINLHLNPENHILACDAYRDDKEVIVTGTLDKSKKHWFFSEVTEFLVIN